MGFSKMTKAQLIKHIEKLATDIASDLSEASEHRMVIARLQNEKAELQRLLSKTQRRVLTLDHLRGKQLEEVQGYYKLIEGLQTLNNLHIEHFDVRSPQMQNALSRLFTKVHGDQLFFQCCPKCGSIEVKNTGRTGNSICDKCLKDIEWPYPEDENHIQPDDISGSTDEYALAK